MGLNEDDSMTPLKKLQSRIKRKTKDLQELESKRLEIDIQISAARGAISALEETLKDYPKEDVDGDPARSLRAGGSVARIYDLLKKHGKPMHIKEILEAMGKNTDIKSQQATGSQLNSYVRQSRIFSRDLPNIFGLREWAANTNDSPTDTEGVQAEWPLAGEG